MPKVTCIEDTNGLPAARYYASDGIHLSHSGIKRLLDGINRHVNIDDFQACVIGSLRRQFSRGNIPGQNTIKQFQRQPPETEILQIIYVIRAIKQTVHGKRTIKRTIHWIR